MHFATRRNYLENFDRGPENTAPLLRSSRAIDPGETREVLPVVVSLPVVINAAFERRR